MLLKQENLPPCNIECEEAILGSILFDPNALARVTPIIKPESFFVTAYRKVYEAMLDISKGGDHSNLIFVIKYLHERDLLDEVGGVGALAKMMYGTVSATNIDRYAMVVQQKYTRRQLIQAANEIDAIAHDGTIDIKEVVSRSHDLLSNVCESTTISETRLSGDIASECFDEVEKICPIYPTGLAELDNLMVGFEPGTLTVLAGRASSGKTAIANFFTFQNAINHQLPSVYFSLEMTAQQLQYRLWSLLSNHPRYANQFPVRISGDRLRKKRAGLIELTPEESESIAIAASISQDLPIFVNDTRGISVQEIQSECRRIKTKHGGLGLVVIDYLQMMATDGGSESNRSYELGAIARNIYNMSSELEVPIIALSQVGRGVEQRSDKRPMMSDLSQSGILEMVADNIIFAYREEYYDPDTPKQKVLELILAKARHGITGNVEVFFDKSCGLLQSKQLEGFTRANF